MSETMQATAPDTRSFAMIRTLGAIALISGLLVVLVFEWTKPLIEANKRELIERAVFQVIPGATQRRDFLVGEDGVKPAGETRGNGIIIYAAYDDAGALKGIAAEAAAQGYQDVIRLLYGYSPACQCITGIRVLKLSETPGLGDKIITDAAFVANFNALEAALNESMSALANAITTVKHGSKQNPWEIDAISGATISSKAVGKALNDSTQRLLPLVVPRIEELKDDSTRRSQSTRRNAEELNEKVLSREQPQHIGRDVTQRSNSISPSASSASSALNNFFRGEA
jgi:electron transport complex protein RnfG